MIKDIVVHLSGSEEDEVRLAYAETISECFDAHLAGLYVHLLPEMVGADAVTMVGMDAWYEQSNTEAEVDFKRLKQRFERLRMPHDVRRLDVLSGTAGPAIANRARLADLFVTTRPYGDPSHQGHAVVSVLFGSGRACFFVPPKGSPAKDFKTLVVAWDGSREAARAVAEAMPFLRRASQVMIVTVLQGDDDETGGDIARHLSRHGISAVISRVDAGIDGAGGALLTEVQRVGANLLVMGGYGHSRLREWILGGVTRHVLTHSHVPVLMAR